jgi:hypothetical protein
MTNLSSLFPTELVKSIFVYLELDVQWSLHRQPKWVKKWMEL